MSSLGTEGTESGNGQVMKQKSEHSMLGELKLDATKIGKCLKPQSSDRFVVKKTSSIIYGTIPGVDQGNDISGTQVAQSIVTASSESIGNSDNAQVTSSLLYKQPSNASEAYAPRRQSSFADRLLSLWQTNGKRPSNDIQNSGDEDQKYGTARRRSKTSTIDRLSKESSQCSGIDVRRKRSSTGASESRQIFMNTSIFKQEGSNDIPCSIPIITHEVSFGDDGLMVAGLNDQEFTSNAFSSGKPHMRSITIVSPDDYKRNSQDASGDYAMRARSSSYGHQKSRQPSAVDTWINANTVNNSDRLRHSSLATFITKSESCDVYKQKTRYSLDSLRVPRRWMSLRNVISVFNVIILLIAILTVTLVSFYSGSASTALAISSMSNTTINNVMLKLDGAFSGAERINIFTESIYSSPEYPIHNTMRGLRHLYALMTFGTQDYDQIYVIGPDNMFAGVALDQDYSTGEIDSKHILVKYLNRTTRPNRWVVRIQSNCIQNDTSCVLDAFSPSNPPLQVANYSAMSRPFFRQAIAAARPGYSSVYTYAQGITFGITAVRPVYFQSRLQFVSAVDISLATLAKYFQDAAVSLTGDTSQIPLFFAIERRTGYLVATSSIDIPNMGPTGDRIYAELSTSEQVRSTIKKLKQMSNGSLRQIVWPDSGGPIVFDEANSHVIVQHYYRGQGDIDWVMVAYIPYSAYNGDIQTAHYVLIPMVSVLVFFLSLIVSVLVTRAIGKPLKRIALEMLSVADLNFEDFDNTGDASTHGGTNQQSSQKQQQYSSQKSLLPISRRISMMRKSPLFNFDIYLKEVQYLRSAMSAMKTGLKSFSKYVPLDVVTLLVKMKREAVLGVDEMEITVLFSDIVNFTSIAEKLEPKVLVQMMKEYLSAMSDIYIQNQGLVDKYVGDAIVAFWNAPLSVKDHASICCSAALKSRQRLIELQQEWAARGLPDLNMRIGINTGKALVGNVGSSTRLNYTCLGDNVNLASRCESLNKRYGTAIMITEYTKNKLHQNYFVTRPLDIVMVRGKSTPVKVYELVGFRKLMKDSTLQAYNAYELAFDAFTNGQFKEALYGFEMFSNYIPKDQVVLQKIETCRNFISRRPSSWNPIVHIESK
ncbi:hypothetical protein MP228_007592 [Amoeboaphelidium protococcarum]|nr:hypothetical protein MP228_007592 [Amoeboaphelidium protococcarum]